MKKSTLIGGVLVLVAAFLTAAFLTSPDAASAAASDQKVAEKLAAVINGDHRTAAEKARDPYRHPQKTLQFFGIEPDMTVVEIIPGGGWYTKILAPFLKDEGTYYAATYAPNPDSEYITRGRQYFEENFVDKPEIYGEIHWTALDQSDEYRIAPDASADMVLTFRNVHNWMGRGWAEDAFAQFYAALKPGGILGVVEHRAPADAKQDPEAPTGYVKQDYVIKLATDAGFRLVGQSEVNANPKDTKDHPKGVWTLPPSLALGETDREKYLAIGESDRMTLKFKKPEVTKGE